MDSLQVTENASASVAIAPRISKEFIESQIAVKGWFQISDALVDDQRNIDHGIGFTPDDVHHVFDHHTVCVLTTKAGFTVIGHSAPASPENFNEELGRQLAYENAFRQLWPLFAFAMLEHNRIRSDFQNK